MFIYTGGLCIDIQGNIFEQIKSTLIDTFEVLDIYYIQVYVCEPGQDTDMRTPSRKPIKATSLRVRKILFIQYTLQSNLA